MSNAAQWHPFIFMEHVSITVWKDKAQRVAVAQVDHIHPYLFLESFMTFLRRQSKHRKGQLEPPASDEKVSVTKNEHFLKLCQEGWDPLYLSAAGSKRDVENTLKLYFGPTIQSRSCRPALASCTQKRDWFEEGNLESYLYDWEMSENPTMPMFSILYLR